MPFFFKMTPATRIVLWFVVAILIGAVLLALPLSSESGHLSLIDSLFTAASAVCVTGLTVVNTASTFSTFGEIVILILIQMGGLGIMTFSTLFFLAVGERLSLGHRMTLKETFGVDGAISIKTILRAIITLTVAVEGIGAVFLYFSFSGRMPPVEAAYFAIFHSVSAFCNAGFSLMEGGLSEYHSNIAVLLGMAFLIITGGIGFSVASEIGKRFRHTAQRTSFSLHTKLALTTTLILLITGTVIFFLLDRHNAYGEYPLHMRIIHSFFQAVTARTAGFDPVAQNRLTNVSILITVFLMMVGASPGSTGGGIKTTSFAIIIAAAVSRVRGSSGVNVFKRTVTADSVIKAISIFILASILVFAATLTLMVVESNFLPHKLSKEMALDYFFETVSAFGTVGLSLGVTPSLGVAGKLVIIIVMFLGRVGLLTVAYLVSRPEGSDRIVYSEEGVMIG